MEGRFEEERKHLVTSLLPELGAALLLNVHTSMETFAGPLDLATHPKEKPSLNSSRIKHLEGIHS